MLSAVAKKLAKSSFVLAAVLGVAFSATPAQAVGIRLQAFGGPTQVEFPGLLMIQFNHINYIGTPKPITCAVENRTIPARDTDTLRFLHSLSESALLTGKTLTIYYDDCTNNGVTVHYLNDVVLVK
jgi:hypothetical protein